MDTQALLQPLELGNIKIKNRVVMAPMTRCRADNPDNAPTDKHVEYYTQRAGAGLIITEGSEVAPGGRGYANVAGMYNDAQEEGWKKVVESVHNAGGKIFLQLWHVGRMSLPAFHEGKKPWAPSAVNPETEMRGPNGEKQQTVEPHAMSVEEIKMVVGSFGEAAARAKRAGFDGVEIHSSNGYLIHQFFNKNSNTRTDQYGGSQENRARFYFEVLEAVKQHFPEENIGCRFNPSLHGTFGIEATPDTIPFFEYLMKRLNDHNLAYVHLSQPFTDVSDVDFLVTDIAKHFRPIYNGTLMINNEYDRESGNKVIENNNADCVAYAKLFISNPDLPRRFELKAETADWNQDTFYTPGREGYTDYPTLEEEKATD